MAISFGDAYLKRFTEVIEPAVKAVTHNGKQLRARRVDLSKSGDLILTDIIDGVAHSAMILADVSVVGHDSKTGEPCRNGNVMYEVGLALACRQPREVLLVRDDKAPFLFDVSTVPHKHIEFSDVGKARTDLANELVARLREVDHLRDARLVVALASLTSQERVILARVLEVRTKPAVLAQAIESWHSRRNPTSSRQGVDPNGRCHGRRASGICLDRAGSRRGDTTR